MKLYYNVTGTERKSLVAAISQELNAPTKYLGAPTFAYEVGGYHIDKNGLVTGEDNSGLAADLCGLHGFKAVREEYDEMLAGNKVYDIITVELPKNGLTDAQVDNIKRLVESKRTLLTNALGRTITVKDTGEHIQFIYPYSEETGVGIIYSQLSAAFVKHVKTNTVMTTILTRLTKNNNER